MGIYGEIEEMGLSASQQLSDCVALVKSLAITSAHMFSGVWVRGSKFQGKHIGLRSISKHAFPQPITLSAHDLVTSLLSKARCA